MNILVTGGYGFIGSHLVERLLKEHYSTTIIDNQTHVRFAQFQKKIPSFKLDTGDKKCERIFIDTPFDVVFHLAMTELSTTPSTSFSRAVDENIAGLSNILCLSQKYNVKKVIVLSSYQIYGKPAGLPVDESNMPVPVEPVGEYYLMMETCCAIYRMNGMNVVALRLGEVYGPRQAARMDHFIAAQIKSWLLFQPPAPPESASRNDYIYVGDVIEAMIRAAEGATEPVLNISSGQGLTQKEVQKICAWTFSNQVEQNRYRIMNDRGDNLEASESPPLRDSADRPAGAAMPLLDDNDMPADPDQNGTDIVLDNRRARFVLDWAPKHSLEDGIEKTVKWAEKNRKQIIQTGLSPGLPTSRLQRLLKYRLRTNPDFENLVIFAGMVLTSILLKTNLGINLDLLVLYIVLINLFYGLRQGGAAIGLAIAARMGFMFFFDGIRIIDMFNDINHIMYLTFYFVVGVSIGYVIDTMRQEKQQLTQDLEKTSSDLDFVRHMYQKSLEIKQSLQGMMTYHEDSLSKALSTVGRLEQAGSDQVYQEAAHVMADVLKIESIHVYQLNEANEWLRLVAVVGQEAYSRSIQVGQHPFLDSVIKQHAIFLNKSLDPQAPMLCAPIAVNGNPVAVFFLDGIDFKMLSQNFINIVKALSNMLSISLQRIYEYNEILKPLKYYPKTIIMKQEWFSRILESLDNPANKAIQSVILLKVANHVPRYDAFNKKVAGLIRETDHLGELEKGQLGIVLNQVDDRDIPAIMDRFASRGYKLELMERGEHVA